MDFNVRIFRILLENFIKSDYTLLPFEQFLGNHRHNTIFLRHDIDRLPENAVLLAEHEKELGIRGTYFFRQRFFGNHSEIISRVYSLGHEIGYHYEDLASAVRMLKAKNKREGSSGLYNFKEKDRFEKDLAALAIESFAENLENLRRVAPVKTICMHGSPMSKWDSRLLWKYYDYHDFGITGEPYFDIDFEKVLYLTDTGRRWDGEQVSVRDKTMVAGCSAQGENPYKDWKIKPINFRNDLSIPLSVNPCPSSSKYKFHSTSDIIKAAEEGRLPDKIMITFHPQRWTDKRLPWLKEFIWQNVKNMGK